MTGAEEAEVRAAAGRLKAAEAEVDRLLRDRDSLIVRIVDAGARVTDIADVLGMSRNAVYGAVERARNE